MRKTFVLVAVLAVTAVSAATNATAEPRDSVSRMFPIYNNGGLPDLTLDPQRFTAQMEIVDRYFLGGRLRARRRDGRRLGLSAHTSL